MKVIYPSLTRQAVAEFELAEYPAVNVLDDHPKRRWQSGVRSATLRITAEAASRAIAVFGTNAETIQVSTQTGLDSAWGGEIIPLTEDGLGIEFEDGSILGVGSASSAWAPSAQWFDGDIESVPILYELSDSGVGTLWAEYGAFDGAHIVNLDMVAPEGETVYAGVVRSGPVIEFPDPSAEPVEGLIDYSIQRELNNGAVYTRVRDIVRTFSFSVLMDRKTEFYTLMKTIIQGHGPRPLSWALLGGTVAEWDFVVYARVQAMPSGTYRMLEYVDVNIELIEVL